LPIIDFHHHLSPSLTKTSDKPSTTYAHGIPVSTEHKGLSNVETHIRMMDETGIDISVLTSGSGMRGELKLARIANESLSKVCGEHEERFRFLAHAAPFEEGGLDEVTRFIEMCPGVAIPSAFGEIGLDDSRLEPLYEMLESKGKYLFVHPAIKTDEAEAKFYNELDLYRTVGREFSLAMATTKLICGGVLDKHPDLQVVMAHLGGGIASLVPRIAHYQNKEMWGVAQDPIHGRTAKEPFESYLKRIYFDTGGFFGDGRVVKIALQCIPKERILLGTDYPQEIRDADPVKGLVRELKSLSLENNGSNLLRLSS
jgi:aminocarboxymuconate-semialdehyde decarboxylase